jgi:shikimate dehydrogenase
MKEVKGTTRVLGLIGNPVEHSISPLIHNTLASLNEDDYVYTTFKVEKNGVADAIRGAYALNVLGLNVTVPYKSEVIDYLTSIDPLAKAIGAVNTLVRTDD